jgi:integrase/recombinase XerD
MSGGPYGRGKAPERQCLPLERWPDHDRMLWQAACAPGSILDENLGERSARAKITNIKDQKGYGRWLTYLRFAEVACLSDAPADRITLERVKRYVQSLRALGNSAATLLARMQELGSVAKIMGPDRSWSFINRLSAKVRAGHRPVRDKLALRPANELVDLGFVLMGSAENLSPLDRAIAYRDGLIIAFLAHVPLRRRNLADLRLGQSLVHGPGGWLVVFEENQTKTHAVYETRLPAALVASLGVYLERYRPVLAARTGRWTCDLDDALWVSRDGSPMTQMAIYDRIRARTAAAFGKALNPHLFRDAAATTMAVNDPEHVRIAAPLLGHRSFSTTEKYYQQATGLQAQRTFIDVIEQIRKRNTDA